MDVNGAGSSGPDDDARLDDPDAGLNLTPRTEVSAPAVKRKRKWGPIIVLALVLVAGVVVVTQFLGNALDYYCNADEVGVKKDCSGDKSLRVQGTVEKGSLVRSATETSFVIGFNGTNIPVVYDGDPGGKFDECIPVVIRGRMKDGTFFGNQLEVKHSNQYAEKNKDRLATADSADCPQAA